MKEDFFFGGLAVIFAAGILFEISLFSVAGAAVIIAFLLLIVSTQ